MLVLTIFLLVGWYGETDLIDKISQVDEKINELFIIKAEYVETLKKSIQEKNNNK